MNRKGCFAFDFDGTIHAHAGYRAEFGHIDTCGLDKAFELGYCVAVMTCNDVDRVAAALEALGYTVLADAGMTRLFWNGGPDGRTVLVTNRKVAASAYFDDRAFNLKYGQDCGAVLAQADAEVTARRAQKAGAA